jgi:hypothetical protein
MSDHNALYLIRRCLVGTTIAQWGSAYFSGTSPTEITAQRGSCGEESGYESPRNHIGAGRASATADQAGDR